MELQHRFTVPAPIDETWAAFNDLERVAPCFPGATLTSVEGDQFSGSVKVKLGPISMQYSGTGTFLERDEANHTARFEAKGKDKRGNGTAAATVRAQLTPEGDGTAVEVSTDLAITGKPAQFGRGVIQDVSDKLLGRFTACLADTLGQPAEAAEARAGGTCRAGRRPGAAGGRAVGAVWGVWAVSRSRSCHQHGRRGGRQPPHRAAHRRYPPRSPAADDEGLDLFRTVAPVLVKRYAVPFVGALVVIYVLVRLIRR